MGVVYEAVDKDRHAPVALKTLRAFDADALLRFKHEFRALADLRHPNLVGLGELALEEGTWFFTMELVHGVDFLAWVRPGAGARSGDLDTEGVFDAQTLAAPPDPRASVEPTPNLGTLDHARLRAALAGLSAGLRALHDARLIHCDVKPSNVLVTREGRVVLVDFGLVAALLDPDYAPGVLAGTVAYMAPEQAAGSALSPAADWYAVGVMLYEALTGRLPFCGSAFEVLTHKRASRPEPPEALAPEAPRDLCALCMDLLQPEPERRPSGDGVRARIGVHLRPSISPPSTALDTPFVGRERELTQLGDAWTCSRTAGPVTVYVYGESGVGKTALVRTFVARAIAADPQAVLLAGRCYERESVPYKAVDGVVDALSRLFSRLPQAEALALLPHQAAHLGQVFPVLGALTKLAPQTAGPKDAADLRLVVFGALRELVGRVAHRFRLVVVIDDLQWADPDSLLLLRDLTAPPAKLGLLLVCTVRTPSRGESARSVQIPTSRLHVGAGAMLGDVREVRVDRLGHHDALALALAIARRVGVPASAAAGIAEEAAGHPLFIDELARHAALAGETAPKVHLDDALWERIRAQANREQELVHTVCVAGTPLPSAAAIAACGYPNAGAFADALAWLHAQHLVRTTLRRGRPCVEPYHDRIRMAVLGQLPADRRELHGRIARALEGVDGAEREMLASHWLGAGDRAKAARYACDAADAAAGTLAFDRAARLYAWSLKLCAPSGPRARAIEKRRGDALVSAGRGHEAGRAYLAAAALSDPSDALDLRRDAARQLLMAGHIDEGLAALRDVLKHIGMELPASPGRAYASLLWRRARLRLRGLSFDERRAADLPRAELQRVDACWTVSMGLGLVDTVRAADFQLRSVLLALSLGEPLRIARALAIEAAYVAGTGARDAWRPLVSRAREIADRLGDPYTLALALGAEGMCCYDVGEFGSGRTLCERAATAFRENCPGTAWETDTARIFSLRSLYMLGDIGTLVEELPGALRDAEDRGDLYLATNLRTGSLNFAWLAVDDPDDARAQLDEAHRQWSTHGVHLQHLQEMLACASLDLYEGAAENAQRRIETIWNDLERAQLLRVAHPRVFASYTRGRANVAVARLKPEADRKVLLRRATADAAVLARAGVDWALGLASLLRGSIAAADGEDARARASFDAAARELAASEMALFAAIARRRRGEVTGGDEGQADIAEADSWMRAHAIVRPDRIAYVYAP